MWLSDDLEAAWRASRLPLAELVRRGLGMEAAGSPVDEPTLRRAVREIIRDELAGLNGDIPELQAKVKDVTSRLALLEARIDRFRERE